MPYVMNALDTKVSVKAFGNYYEFAPGVPKLIHNDNIAHFLVTERSKDGIVGIPEEVMEMDRKSPEFLAEIAKARKVGKTNRINEVKKVIANLEVSLRRDLEQANIKADPNTWASEGEVKAYEELATLAKDASETEVSRADRIKALKEQLSGSTNNGNS